MTDTLQLILEALVQVATIWRHWHGNVNINPLLRGTTAKIGWPSPTCYNRLRHRKNINCYKIIDNCF